MTRRALGERWDADALAKINVSPNPQYVPKDRGQRAFGGRPEASGPTADEVKPNIIRKLRINQSDLDEYGYCVTCPQCTYIQRYGRPRPGQTHNNECRERIIEALKLTDKGRARLELQEERNQHAQEENAATHPTETVPSPPEAPVQPRGFLDRAPDGAETISGGTPDTRNTTGSGDAEAVSGGTPDTRNTTGLSKSPLVPPVTISGQRVPGAMGVPADEGSAMPKPSRTPSASQGLMPGSSADTFGNMPGPARPGGGEPYDPTEDQDMKIDDGATDDDNSMDFIGNFEAADSLGRLEPTFDDEVSVFLLNQLGSSGRSYKREAA